MAVDASRAPAADARSFLIRRPLGVMTGLPGAASRAGSVDIRVVDGMIAAVGKLEPLPAERIVDASGCVVYPGWVNTHHHLFESVMKGVPAGINRPLLPWLDVVPLAHLRFLDERTLRLAATIGIAELLLSGCTTIADHNYTYFPGMNFDSSQVLFDVAERMGVRFVLMRGGATRQRGSELDAPGQARPETLDAIIDAVASDTRRFHDASPGSMRKMVMAPTTPTWSVLPHEMRELARAARRLGIGLHTHLSETADYVRYCREVHDCLPVEFVGRCEWLGPDVWFAHMVHVSPPEIAMLASTGTGIAHCVQSNCRLGSGIAPVPAYRAAGVPVTLGVDGAGSNEAADMVSEAHAVWLVHRARDGAAATTVDDVIHWGTRAGARMMGFGDVGVIAPGFAADIAIHELDQLRHAGLHDPLIGPVASAGAPTLRHLFCAGRGVVEHGRIPGLDLSGLLAEARSAVAGMLA